MESEKTTSVVAKILSKKAPSGFKFIPNEDFYNQIGVRRRRWAMYVRGEADPTITELKEICKYFNVNIESALKENLL